LIPKTSSQLAALVGGALEGAGDIAFTGLSSLADATEHEATFITSDAHAKLWEHSRARIAIVGNQVKTQLSNLPTNSALSSTSTQGAQTQSRALIRVDNADLAVVKVLEMFAPPTTLPALGAHASAVIDASAIIGKDARIGALVSIGAGSHIGNGCVLHAGARIAANVTLGEGCIIHSNAFIDERCVLGARVIIHASAVIGGDGFGYRPAADGKSLTRIPHTGNVVLDDDVEIGANTCVDRAKFGSTKIGAGTKIDNLCQIAHGCRIGRMTVIAGMSGLAGSVTVGNGVQIGGYCGIGDHKTIGDGARLAAKSAVMNDIPAGATWGGMPAQDIREELRVIAAIRKLPQWSRKLRTLLEEQIKDPATDPLKGPSKVQ
jgi:UDP-3-O-[3-hydroxymyristoyl] glucosamine N-acyltransferase